MEKKFKIVFNWSHSSKPIGHSHRLATILNQICQQPYSFLSTSKNPLSQLKPQWLLKLASPWPLSDSAIKLSLLRTQFWIQCFESSVNPQCPWTQASSTRHHSGRQPQKLYCLLTNNCRHFLLASLVMKSTL